MKISTKGRYAIRLMIDIAKNKSDDFISLNEIAKRQDISKKYLELIIPMLSKNGLLIANRGHLGGYKLAREPKDITIGNILRLTESCLEPVACVSNERACPRSGDCLTLPIWKGLSEVINNYLDSITLQDVLDNNNSGDNYVI